MNTAIVNIKIDPTTKAHAQEVAERLGFSLGSLIKAFVKQLVREKRVSFSLSEEPSQYLVNAIAESKKEIKKGWVSPEFDNTESAIAWLSDSSKKYENQIREKIR